MEKLHLLECALRKDGSLLEFETNEKANEFCVHMRYKMPSKMCRKHKVKFLQSIPIFKDMEVYFLESKNHGTLVLSRMGAEVMIHDGVCPFYNVQTFVEVDLPESAEGIITSDGENVGDFSDFKDMINKKHSKMSTNEKIMHEEITLLIDEAFKHVVIADIEKIGEVVSKGKINPVTALDYIQKRRDEILELSKDTALKIDIVMTIKDTFDKNQEAIEKFRKVESKKERQKLMQKIAGDTKENINKIIRAKLSKLEYSL